MHTKLKERLGIGAVAVLFTAVFTALCIVPAMAEISLPADGWYEKGMGRYKHQRSVLGIWRNPQLVQELALSEDQIDQLRNADFTGREKQLEMKSQLKGLELQIDKALSNENVEENAVRQLATKMADIRGRLFVQHVESRLTAAKILSTDQLDKLRLMKMQQRRRGPRRGWGAVSAGPSANLDCKRQCSYALNR